MYLKLFGWMVAQVNAALMDTQPDAATGFLGILDIYGAHLGGFFCSSRRILL